VKHNFSFYGWIVLCCAYAWLWLYIWRRRPTTVDHLFLSPERVAALIKKGRPVVVTLKSRQSVATKVSELAADGFTGSDGTFIAFADVSGLTSRAPLLSRILRTSYLSVSAPFFTLMMFCAAFAERLRHGRR